jgi:hypothetical protein
MSLFVWIVLTFLTIIIVTSIIIIKKYKMIPITEWCSHYALFFNDDGSFNSSKKIKYFDEPVFSHKNKLYNFKPKLSSRFTLGVFLKYKKYYIYNINNSEPILLNAIPSPVISPDVHKSLYENELVKDLCALAENPLITFIKKFWWVFLIIIAIIWFFNGGQDLFIKKGAEAVTNSSIPMNVTTYVKVK